MMADPITTTLAWTTLYAGHHVGDYWAQTDHQAMTKGQCDHHGRMACAGHVATLTIAQALMLALVAWATGTETNLAAAVLGLTVNAASHYWADRRQTLRGLVLALDPITSKKGFYEHVPGAPLQLDQAWHIAWIIPSALIIAAPVVLAAQLTGGAALVLLACAIASRLARRAERKAAEAAARQDDADENGVDLRA